MESEPEFIKYPEIPHLMESLEILDEVCLEVYEKLDGGNSQVRVYKGQILTGTRANFLYREEFFMFPWFKDFNKWAKSNYSFYNLPENLIVFGEFLAHHTRTYKPEFVNKFFFIDLYDLDKKRFIPYEDARKCLEDRLGIKDVIFLTPLAKGRLNLEKARKLALEPSVYSDEGKEGIIIKDYTHQKFAKLWRTSANSTKKGLIEEINKTILSLYHIDSSISLGILSLRVYRELRKSGRDISLAEISKTIKKIVDKNKV
ncbi:MAG: RNA ligase family protein [Candidatus Pacearchaeota archaeon]